MTDRARHERELARRDGHPAGDTGGSCTVTTVDPSGALTGSCQATARLRDGLITTQALVTFGPGLQALYDAAAASLDPDMDDRPLSGDLEAARVLLFDDSLWMEAEQPTA